MKQNHRIQMLIVLLFLLLCIFLSLAFGSKQIAFQEVVGAFIHPFDSSFSYLVVRERIPRTIFSLLAGASLGIAGSLMQSITRNPIADPSILGINAGASLFVVGGIAFLQISTYQDYIYLALWGATLSTFAVYGIASLGYEKATPIKLALAGSIISIAFSSLISVIMLPRSAVMNTFRFWQVGSVSGANMDAIVAILPFLVLGIVLSIVLAKSLNALALGDEVAITLGVNINLVRLLGATSCVLLCGSVTALAGPIGFVGLMVPHMVRLLFGNEVRMNLVLSAYLGALLLTFADVIGRILGSPGEVEVGIITAFLGAPIFLLIVMKSRVTAL